LSSILYVRWQNTTMGLCRITVSERTELLQRYDDEDSLHKTS